MEKRKIFNNDRLNHEIARDGFVLMDFLPMETVLKLKEIITDLNSKVDHSDVHVQTPFHLSCFNNNVDYKKAIYYQVWDLMKEKLSPLLNNYEPLVVNVFEKYPGHGGVHIHQNPSFVEEPHNKTVSVWIPLLDTTKHNGTLGVLRGSNDTFDTLRAANMPDVFEKVNDQLINKYFEPVIAKMGQIAVLDDSMLHWSYPNNSNEVRITIQLIMIPLGTKHIYYYYNTSGPQPKMDLYTVDKDFFFNFNCKAEPEGLPKVGEIPFKYHFFSEEELVDKVSVKNPAIRALYQPQGV